MEARTFEEAFNAMFHKNLDLEKFLRLDVSEVVSEFSIDDRNIVKVSGEFRKFLRFIDKVILRNLQVNDSVHSFSRGRSILTAVKAHAENRYFFQTDIEGFYSKITKNNVFDILHKNKSNIPILDIEDYTPYLADVLTYNDVLPVGYPTSPQLSNAFLYDFDCEFGRVCKDKNITYTRYADDIILSKSSYFDLSETEILVQEILNENASQLLSLNKSKTRTMGFDRKVKILGLTILPNGRVTIDLKIKRKIETLLYLYSRGESKYDDYLESEFNGERSVFGILNYINAVDPLYLGKLQRKYGVYSIRKLMEYKWNDEK